MHVLQCVGGFNVHVFYSGTFIYSHGSSDVFQLVLIVVKTEGVILFKNELLKSI